MLRLPSRFAAVILAFAPVFLQQRTWCHAEVLLIRAAWSGRAAARVLLGLLLGAFAPRGPVVLGLDDTIERRRGRRIGAKGIYRDPVRSSKGHFVKASGLRPPGAVLPRGRAAPKEADRRGAAAGPAGPPLDAGPAADPRG